MAKGVDFSNIIDQSFYQKSYIQNQVMGRVLAESIMLLDGKCIVGYMKMRDMEFYGVQPADLDGIVSQLRLTKGVEVAMFIYEHASQLFKVVTSFQWKSGCKQDCILLWRRRPYQGCRLRPGWLHV